MSGKIDRATAALNGLKGQRKALTETTARLAVIDHAQGRRQQAHAALDELLQKEPANARLLLLKGRLLFQEGEVDAAAERISAAVSAEPRAAAARYLLGLIQLARRQRSEAIRTFNDIGVHMRARSYSLEGAAVFMEGGLIAGLGGASRRRDR